MKIAVISDIHANNYYLNETLRLVAGEKVDDIYCLGDVIGYYDCPNEVIETCIEWNIKSVKGNHEKFALSYLEYDPVKEVAYRLKLQMESLTSRNYEYVINLPESLELAINGKTLFMTHSLPESCTDYIYDIRQLDPKFLSRYDYYCFGHTHKPLINYHYGTCVLNPGSVGQPRDYSKKPSFLVLDLAEETTKLVKVEIDDEPYTKSLEWMGYSSNVVEMLRRSRIHG
jgi:putative phosphoesterase